MQSTGILSATKYLRSKDIRWISVCKNSQVWKSYYDVLGVSKNCSVKEIKAAYFKLSKKYHPDRNDSTEAADKFREISTAYEVLKNDLTRQEYDRGERDFDRPRPVRQDPIVVRPFREHREQPTGKRKEFDYDTWERMHYGEQLRQRQRAKVHYDFQQTVRQRNEMYRKMDRMVIAVISLLAMMMMAMSLQMSDKDEPKPIKDSKK